MPHASSAARTRLRRARIAGLLLFLLGTGLRLLYVSATPYTVRSHDIDEHLNYIDSIARHGTLPVDDHLSVAYHPPLYFLLGAAVRFSALRLSLSDENGWKLVQLLSVALSLVALASGLSTGLSVLRGERSLLPFALFGSVLATIPSFVFASGRINNDILAALFSFLALDMLLRWWKGKGMRYWYVCLLCLSGALLSKANALLLLPIAFGCLILIPRLRPSQKLLHVCCSLLLICAVAGMYFLPRWEREHDLRTVLVGNVGKLTNFVENTPSHFLVFHPVQLLAHPFNDPFNDSERRQYFWEYFFRSALYGEFSFDSAFRPLALALILSALLALPFALLALGRDILRGRSSPTLPLWLAVIVLLLGHVAFRAAFPYSSSQDFRYSLTLLLPLAYYAVAEWRSLPPLLQSLRATALLVFAGSSCAFLVLLAVRSFSGG